MIDYQGSGVLHSAILVGRVDGKKVFVVLVHTLHCSLDSWCVARYTDGFKDRGGGYYTINFEHAFRAMCQKAIREYENTSWEGT